MMGPIIHCRMCLHKVVPVLELNQTPIANAFADAPDTYAMRYPLGLSQCPSCQHVQISYNIDGSELYSGYAYRTPDAERPRLKEYAESLARRYPNALTDKNSRTYTTLEIGCNNGRFCDALAAAGFYPIGIDPVSKRWGGMPKWFNSKTARQIANSMGKAKLIVSNNTFAHVDDLRNVLLGVRYLLADDGHLVFEVQYMKKLEHYGMFDMIYHEHKDYHTLAPWPRLLAKFGLCIVDVEYPPTHGGSIRLHVGYGDKNVALPDEGQINWKVLADRIESTKGILLKKVAKVNGTVAAFGATAKSCTLIHHVGLADRIAYCVDETPEKQGKYIPGTAIEIVSPDRLKSDPPEAVLITAWNYADMLRPRFQCDVIVPFEDRMYPKAA